MWKGRDLVLDVVAGLFAGGLVRREGLCVSPGKGGNGNR